ncbi:MAG TPA: class I SAM-dependent methyltransferase [candidate division Zixibacteria bacterium]|nr:methyltransferase domain-containing protein [candidate division Zixibacteria bacterium]MDD4917369.1 class I SAM-dependent methyltransferase [candidate division Zixibacteria bacterium]MDM7971927.1 class I SAM-dependent methyltransferase [candidate division Zixibacteria bacterium]HOD66239.1 class I SAM-dependent methyltransferase [candidate division Zixibacteria bacterium]HOZ06704.1 class I SAM-dependent methyltransferase [candidate division Zixibacteria bacterium]
MLKPEEDAFGRGMCDHLHGRYTSLIVERDDGFIDASHVGHRLCLERYARWWKVERQAIRYARGRVLDVGCGAGRVALHLQEKGHPVVAIDYSPLLVHVCRERGVRDVRLMRFADVSADMGVFDAVVLFGGNFGLLETLQKGRRMLRRLHGMTSDRGRIIASVRHPYKVSDVQHLEYHECNRRRGRRGGQLRLRVRYEKLATPWFDYLLVSPEELREIVAGTGWQVSRLFEDESAFYSMVLTKEAAV